MSVGSWFMTSRRTWSFARPPRKTKIQGEVLVHDKLPPLVVCETASQNQTPGFR